MTPDGLPMEWRWRMAAMPQWSLHYEWLFYCTLPVLALLLTRRANWIWLLCSALVLTFVVQNLAHDLSKSWHITPFVSGVLSAVLERRAQRWRFIQNQLVPMGAGIIVFASAFIGKQEILFVVANTILMLCVITNNKGLSWLGNTRLQCLGEISFGIYIFHGIVQVGAIEVFGGQPAIHHWPFPAVALWISIQVAIVCFFANIANKYIEKPCIEFGRRLSNLLNLT
jgi:peptidoglycan/LPS O-acetylase OafA/YrhL